MKKLFILSILFAGSITLQAQTLEEITELTIKQQYKAAKVAVDKFLADPKNAEKSDGWYFKGRIYNALSYDAATPKLEAYDLKLAAFDAFKKTQQLDPKDIRLKTETYNSYLDLYFGFFDLGANLFNTKDYPAAFNSFKKALEVKDFILAKQYTYPQAKLYPLDTALVLNTAIAATQMKKDDEAITYYRKLIDANVAGKDYEDIYLVAADYYVSQKDQASLDQLLEKAKRFYPANEAWTEIELKTVPKTGDKAALYAKYDELLAKNPTSFSLAYNYAIEIYNSLYGQDQRPADVNAAKEKLSTVLKSAIANDKGIDATVLMSNHLFNVAADYSTQASLVKGAKPDDVKRKNELKSKANKGMDEFIPYAEAAVKYFEAQPSLKAGQKASFQNILAYLAEVYNAKGDAKKSAEYDKKKSAIKF